MSTTLIQAIRHFVDLYSSFFEMLRFLTDGLLEILSICMTQGSISSTQYLSNTDFLENETLARIGSTCLQQMIVANLDKMDNGIWEKTCKMLLNLFVQTTPDELSFDLEESSEFPRGSAFGFERNTDSFRPDCPSQAV
jgi:brefeldin A-inhibited guanine nucleotide-exchange protein